MRLLRDIWILFRYILPQGWKTQRQISFMEKHISKMEKENGVCHTFLNFFELSQEHGVSEEELCYMLETFVSCANKDIIAEDEWTDVQSYVDKYLS